MDFWKQIPKPFVVLAPMANVTDCVFRKLIAKYGPPDVFWTEFVSADGLMSRGGEHLHIDLKYSRKERPIVAQLFTGHPEAMFGAAKFAAELGFNGVDINTGCPDRAVEKQGGGSALIKSPRNAVSVVEAARAGVAAAGKALPVSVKTRLGYNKIDHEWIRTLLELRLPALTIHMRTRKEMSAVPAHWEVMPDIIALRDEISPETLIIGNGDVSSLPEAFAKTAKYGCDGVMVGRGVFGQPWFFENIESLRHSARDVGVMPVMAAKSSGEALDNTDPYNVSGKSPEFRMKVMIEHARAFEREFKGVKNFDVMKKHFKAYVSGWDGAKELRVKLMATENSRQVADVVRKHGELKN